MLQSVHVAETSTDKVPNASPTAASASSDLYGAAILDACRQLNERLAPIRSRVGPDASMHDIAEAAWFERIDLCAHGFYRTPDITGAILIGVLNQQCGTRLCVKGSPFVVSFAETVMA